MRIARVVDEAWMHFMIHCFIFFLLAASMTSSQKQNRSNEVMALLDFKHNSIEADPKGFLDDWSPSSLSPCSWGGVSCSLSGQVSALNFTNGGLIGRWHIDDLLVLESLRHLYLSGNLFSGNLSHNKDSYPCNIETLDLSFNNLSEPISETFFESCGSLASLNLSHNLIPGGSFHIGNSLLELDLSSNLIRNTSILNNLLSNCQNVRQLNLSDTKLSCGKLSILNLSFNRLSGKIPASFFSNLPPSIEFLDISHNNLSANFSTLEFKHCEKLLVLNLSNNVLYGSGLPLSLTSCQFLENLDLSYNKLRDKIPADLGNLGNLKLLNLAHNAFSGNVPPELGRTCGTLIELNLSENTLSGQFPKTFNSCDSLQSLNLGNNQLSGNFLTTVISTLPRLEILQVPFNNISGPIPPSLGNLTKLQVLDLSSNAFSGNVPAELCSSSSLQKLLVAGNFLSGSVPSDIGNCNNLRTIDFSLNNLNGSIPPNVWMLPHLSGLIIWGNSFSGEIPKDICLRQSNFEALILNNNLFSGPIPESISHCKNLLWLSLSFNHLRGKIPAGIGTQQKLSILLLDHNSFTGRIPPELGSCQSLIWLDLNNNHFSGSIPSELTNKTGVGFRNDSEWHYALLRYKGENGCNAHNSLLYLEGIRQERLDSFLDSNSCPVVRVYRGMIVPLMNSKGGMIFLDLSFNLLFGSIPDSFGSMSYLQILNLGHNRLTGTIPESLGSLKGLGVLDLSYNQLEGGIPTSWQDLTFLSQLDLSNNNLSGTIPSTGQFQTFSASSYENNSGLCGYPLPPCGSKQSQTDNPSTASKKSPPTHVLRYLLPPVSLIVVLITVLLIVLKKYRNKKTNLPVKEENSLPLPSWRRISYYELLQATGGFSESSLIGSGSFGTVYQGTLQDETTVAIKVFNLQLEVGLRSFDVECEVLRNIRHRNLVKIITSCCNRDFKALVLESMPNGSLEKWLHSPKYFLDLNQRLNIMIEVASALDYLHSGNSTPVIHCDLKPSNVLLDSEMVAHVCDFGMAKLLGEGNSMTQTMTLATFGYMAPEYGSTGLVSPRGDVYSYGILLMETFTGTKPTNEKFAEEMNLRSWVKESLPHAITKVADASLLRKKKEKHLMAEWEMSCISSVLQLAVACCAESPSQRKDMKDVFLTLTKIKDKFLKERV